MRSNEPHFTAAQIEQRLWEVHIPFRKVPVWHRIKFQCENPVLGTLSTVDSIHVRPARYGSHGETAPARFDTAYVNDGRGGDIGVQGNVP